MSPLVLIYVYLVFCCQGTIDKAETEQPTALVEDKLNSAYTHSRRLGGTCRLKDFRFGRELGRGSDGVVKIARHIPSGKDVAIKHIWYAGSDFKREESILHSLDHPKIVKHYCTMDDEDGGAFLVMELAEGHTLEAILSSSSLYHRQHLNPRSIIRQLVEIVDYLQSHGFANGDIASDNVVIDRHNHVKLIDFGDAVRIGKHQESPSDIDWGQTRPYLWKNYCSDWYSLGLLMLEILVATTKDPGNTHWVQQSHFHRTSCQRLLGSRQSTACDLIDHLRTRDFDNIWGTTERTLSKIRHHPWFRE